MYEMERFNWQKLLIHNVPHKGGRSYAAVTPPPNYAPQWSAAQSLIVNSEQTMKSVGDKIRQIPSLPDYPAQLIIAEQVNTQIDAKVREADSVVAQVNSIPDSAFNSEQLSTLGLNKSGALGLINSVRSGLINSKVSLTPPTVSPPPPPPPPVVYISPPVPPPDPSSFYPDFIGVGQGRKYVDYVVSPAYGANGIVYPSESEVERGLPYYAKPQPGVTYKKYSAPPPPYVPPPYVPTFYEVLSTEVEKQTKLLQSFNRIWNKPVDPAPAAEIYPPSSWQYEFWQKGYSLTEIRYAEDYAAASGVMDRYGGDFAVFKKVVEDYLQDTLIFGEGTIKQRATGLRPLPIMDEIVRQNGIEDPAINIRNADPEVTVLTSQPTPTSHRCGAITTQIPKPIVDLPIPLPPNSDPKKMPRRRGFIPSLKRLDPPLPPPPGAGWCGTGTVPRPGNWEDAIIGAGASVDELDTIRRMMTIAKFASNADQASAAIGMLNNLRNQNGTNAPAGPMAGGPGIGLPPPFLPGEGGRGLPPPIPVTKAQEAEQRRQIARARALNKSTANPISKIEGVLGLAISPPVLVRANTIAKRQTSIARRGAINGRNLRSMSQGSNEGGNGGSNN